MTPTASAQDHVDPFEAYLEDLFDLDPLTDAERAELLAPIVVDLRSDADRRP